MLYQLNLSYINDTTFRIKRLIYLLELIKKREKIKT